MEYKNEQQADIIISFVQIKTESFFAKIKVEFIS